MKEYLAELVRAAQSPLQGRNVAREYLQARILGAMQRAEAMLYLAFHGGTALRFLYGHHRYSEDLDFALERAHQRYDLRTYLKSIRSELSLEGYLIEVKLNDRKTVQNAFVRFMGLLHELNLSPHRDEVLSVKVEVDTNPPAGAVLDTTVVRRYEVIQLQHHDKSSLLAGKLHAILQRTYLKGRDLYDLLWYLSDPSWPEPNLIMLNNALQQTGWVGEILTGENWRDVVWQKLRRADWKSAAEDVHPFLEREADLRLVTRDNLSRVLTGQDSSE
jgi:predicted nucleotidyltransferase component of viral defense system